MKHVAGIGNLYTAERGVDMIVRNLIANPRIIRLVLCGENKSGSLAAMHEFFNGDLPMTVEKTASGREYYTVGGDARVWADIPQDIVEAVRHDVATSFMHSDAEPRELVEVILSSFSEHGFHGFRSYEPQLFPPILEEPDHFPAPYSGQILRAKTIGRGYLELLHHILTYGKKIGTHYDQMSLEIMDLVMVITDHDAHGFMHGVPDYIPFTPQKIEEYCMDLLNPEEDTSVTYTYGNRMRQHFGVDQLKYVAEKLAADRGSRSAVVNLWDAKRRQQGSPCLNHLWFRIMDGKLFMTATIRSNDMYLGWPENAYGLRYLQDWVRTMTLKMEGAYQDDSGLDMGDLVIVSQSAHLYSDCWAPAQEIVDEHRRYKEWWDEKGQWTFKKTGGPMCIPEGCVAEGFEATLHSPEGEHLTTIKGTPSSIRMEIARRGLISDVGHAMYVGQMLEKTART
jgi:thymidylate synthase